MDPTVQCNNDVPERKSPSNHYSVVFRDFALSALLFLMKLCTIYLKCQIGDHIYNYPVGNR